MATYNGFYFMHWLMNIIGAKFEENYFNTSEDTLM